MTSSSPPPARFESFKQRASLLVEQPSRVQALLQQGKRKFADASGDKFSALRRHLTLTFAMLQAWIAGDYRQLSNKTLVILIAALLYFVVPMDVIPDFLFGWGFIDDAAVLGYVFSQLGDELSEFERWQNSGRQSRNDDGDSGAT